MSEGPERKKKQLKKLVKKSFKLRRKWIMEGTPPVSAIAEKFPGLRKPNM